MPVTGSSRPRSVASSSIPTRTAAASPHSPRVRVSTDVVWSPSPPRVPSCPPIRPRSVDTDIQLRISVGVSNVVAHPSPSPVPSASAAYPSTAIAASTLPTAATSRTRPPRRRAHSRPRKPSASSAGSFTADAPTMRTVPSSNRWSSSPGPARRPTSIPTSMSPIINASLWMPLTRWNSTRGLAAPSHSASPASNPHRRASRGSAQMIMARPASASTRCASTPRTTSLPVRAVIPRPSTRNSGPYGAGVSRQIVGMLRVNGSSTPSASAGSEDVGVEPAVQDRALGEVAVHVAGEHRRRDGQRERPQRGRPGELEAVRCRGHGAVGAEHLPDPQPGQHEHADARVGDGDGEGGVAARQSEHAQSEQRVGHGQRRRRPSAPTAISRAPVSPRRRATRLGSRGAAAGSAVRASASTGRDHGRSVASGLGGERASPGRSVALPNRAK